MRGEAPILSQSGKTTAETNTKSGKTRQQYNTRQDSNTKSGKTKAETTIPSRTRLRLRLNNTKSGKTKTKTLRVNAVID